MIEGYITASEAAINWNLKPRTVQKMCQEGRIICATKVGNMWLIPENTQKPVDMRIKSGKYVKN